MKRRKKVGHVFVTLPMGGAENILLSILKNLDSEDYESVVFCLGEKGALGERVEAMGVRLICLDQFKKSGLRWSLVKGLAASLEAEQIDLVHANLYHANLYARLACKLAKIPCIIAVHNTYARVKWHRSLLNRLCNPWMKKCIVGSPDIRLDVLRHDRVPEAKVVELVNSIDLSMSQSTFTKAEARSRIAIPQDVFVLGTVARLEDQKGIAYMLEALLLLKAKGIAVHYVVVGSGAREADLKAYAAKHDLEDCVSFLGTRSDLGDLFRAMDAYVMPSLWEGLSLAMLSASAAGLPVVATDVGGVADVLSGGKGYIIQPGDAQALAQTIEHVTTHIEEAQARAQKAQAYVIENYSDKAFVEKLQNCYEDVLRGVR